MIKEFKEFAMRGNVLDMAVGIIIGAAFGQIVNSFVQGDISNNAGGLILWPVKAVIPLGFFMLTLQGVSELIKRVAALMGLVRMDTHYEKPLQ